MARSVRLARIAGIPRVSIVVLAVVAAAAAGCASSKPAVSPVATPSQSPQPPRFQSGLVWDGHHYDAVTVGRPKAVVVLLHSDAHVPASVEKETGLVPVAEAQHWLLAVPAGTTSSWDAGLCCGRTIAGHPRDGVVFLHGFLQYLLRGLPAQTPVVLVGDSNGGMLALDYDCRGYGDIDRAIAVSGNLETPTCAHPDAPFTMIRGAKDGLVPIAGTATSKTLRTHLQADAIGIALLTRGMGCSALPSAAPVAASAAASSAVVPPIQPARWQCPRGISSVYTDPNGGHGWPRTSAMDATSIVTVLIDQLD
jgi:poly(3-hydroxybutyrate) depolymerase